MGRSVSLYAAVLCSLACGPTIFLEDESGDSTEGPQAGAATRTTGQTTSQTTTGFTTRGPDSTGGRETLDTGGVDVTTTPPPPPPSIPDFSFPPNCAGLGELGDPCVEGSECCSNECFVVGPLGGVCSECDSDVDCEFGCNFGSPLVGMPAVCGDGSLGSGCETPDACLPGLACAPIIEIPGIIESSACSDCEVDSDCIPGQHCAPLYLDGLLTGFWYCTDPATVPEGEGCGGDEECTTGQCAPAALMGIPVLTVCAECNEDADCPGGTCILPEILADSDGLVLEPGLCA